LILVDGICPVAQYLPFLLAFAPLDDIFEVLENLDLVRRVGKVSSETLCEFRTEATEGLAASTLPRINSMSKNSGSMPL
jgi:hypothetical protein